jgi:membrane protein DedA with SNARE-associated domain
MEPLGLLAIAAVVLVKETGVPIPVPGDLIVVGAGVAAARGAFDPWIALVAIVVATLIGGSLQYFLIRGPGRHVLLAVFARFGIPSSRIEAAADRLRRRGARGIAIARATPGIRIVAIAACGLAALPFPVFILGLAIGNALFVAAHFALGLVAGEAAVRLVGSVLGPAAVLVGVLAAAGGVGWWLIRRQAMRRGVRSVASDSVAVATAGPAGPPLGLTDPAAAGLAWADAACPACLLIGRLSEA